MKKILFGFSVFFATLISAQNYPDYYPSNDNYNNGYYGDYDDEYYFPDDYYYEYPSDYYTNDFYQSSYNDYQRSIYDINWNQFFARYRLAPWQVQQIIMLNEMYPSFSAWNTYYRYNPDRWYYDRYFALQQILGPRVFVIFQNNYFNGYSPVVYWQNYRRQHYVTNVYILPRYRNVNINRYRVDRNIYHQNNPRNNVGFQNTPRQGNGNWGNSGGFRNDAVQNNNGGFRNGAEGSVINAPNAGIRGNNNKTPQNSTPRNNGGFRSGNSEIRTQNTPRIENNSGGTRNQAPKSETPRNSTRNSGQRFTSR